MIATILHSSSSFSAVRYNEQKMQHGQAELIAMKNFGAIGNRPDLASIQDKRDFLVDYSARNTRIKKAQFHAAISCKGREYSKEQLEKIAWEYLRRMGYGEDGQPVLMYYHHDTGNNHLHIVTSRVSPSGRKISDSNEKMRSLKVINQLMGVDEKQRKDSTIKKAMAYNFQSFAQFMAILETSGYECYKKGGNLCVKRGGMVMDTIRISEIEKRCKQYGEEQTKRQRQLRAILKKYRDLSSSKEELQEKLKKQFGVELKFLGKEQSPYGYIIVDNATKTVFKGGDVLPLKELVAFKSKEERLKQVDFFIEDKLRENPNVTTFGLNHDLRRYYGCYISHGCIVIGKDKTELADYLVQRIKFNDKVDWVQGFSPKDEAQVHLLSKLFNVPEDKLHTESDAGTDQAVINKIQTIIDDSKDKDVFDNLHAEGIWTYRFEGRLYCIDTAKRTVVDVKATGIKTEKLKASINTRDADVMTSATKHHVTKGRVPRVSNEIGSGDHVTQDARNSYGEVDDERAMIRRS